MDFFKRFKRKKNLKTKEEYLEEMLPGGIPCPSIPTSYWRDEAFFYEALRKSYLAFFHIPRSIEKDEKKFIKAIQTNKKFFESYISRRKTRSKSLSPFTTKYNIMLNAVLQDGMNLTYISKSLKPYYRELTLEAVKQTGRVFYWLKGDLAPFREDFEITKEAAKSYNIFFELSDKFKKDPEIAKTAILYDSYQLPLFWKFAKDKDFVCELIKQKAEIVQYIKYPNRYNKKDMLDLVKINPEVMLYAPKSIRDNFKFNLRLAEKNGAIFPYLTVRFKRNSFFQFKAIESGVPLAAVTPHIFYEKGYLAPERLLVKVSNTLRLKHFSERLKNKKIEDEITSIHTLNFS